MKRRYTFPEALQRIAELPLRLDRIYMSAESYAEALRLAGVSEEEIAARLAALEEE